MQKQRCKEKRWITETDSKHFKGGALRTIKNIAMEYLFYSKMTTLKKDFF